MRSRVTPNLCAKSGGLLLQGSTEGMNTRASEGSKTARNRKQQSKYGHMSGHMLDHRPCLVKGRHAEEIGSAAPLLPCNHLPGTHLPPVNCLVASCKPMSKPFQMHQHVTKRVSDASKATGSALPQVFTQPQNGNDN
jgi:hypothetical protein